MRPGQSLVLQIFEDRRSEKRLEVLFQLKAVETDNTQRLEAHLRMLVPAGK